MNLIKWVSTGVTVLSLTACAVTGVVDVTSQSATTYAPVPVSSVNISSYPPVGKYSVIATMNISPNMNETPTQLLSRLQKKGAELGADYVMVTSVTDKTYLTPQNLDSTSNAYLATQQDFYNTAGSTYNNSIDYTREIITAQALKITSGSNKPNKKAQSMVWQMNN